MAETEPKPHTVPHPHTRAHTDDEQFDATPAIVTSVVLHFEDDLRAVLNYYEHDYLPAHLVHPLRRLRLLVGR